MPNRKCNVEQVLNFFIQRLPISSMNALMNYQNLKQSLDQYLFNKNYWT